MSRQPIDLDDDVESRIARIIAFGKANTLSPRATATLVIECLAKVGYAIRLAAHESGTPY